MSALQNYFDAERLRRGWSMREAAKRSQISLSKAYAIVKGDDNVEFETFENIAAAFDMTPAELAIVIGKGSAEHDPEETKVISAYRRVPEHKRTAAIEMLDGLAIRPSSGHRDGSSTPRSGGRRHLNGHQHSGDDTGTQGSVPTVYSARRATLAGFSLENVLAAIKHSLQGSSGWATA